MTTSYRWVGGDEGEFVNDGTGPTEGGLLFAAVPDHLRDEFGPTCVILWHTDGRSTALHGELATRARDSYLSLIPSAPRRARRLATAS